MKDRAQHDIAWYDTAWYGMASELLFDHINAAFGQFINSSVVLNGADFAHFGMRFGKPYIFNKLSEGQK